MNSLSASSSSLSSSRLESENLKESSSAYSRWSACSRTRSRSRFRSSSATCSIKAVCSSLSPNRSRLEGVRAFRLLSPAFVAAAQRGRLNKPRSASEVKWIDDEAEAEAATGAVDLEVCAADGDGVRSFGGDSCRGVRALPVESISRRSRCPCRRCELLLLCMGDFFFITGDRGFFPRTSRDAES